MLMGRWLVCFLILSYLPASFANRWDDRRHDIHEKYTIASEQLEWGESCPTTFPCDYRRATVIGSGETRVVHTIPKSKGHEAEQEAILRGKLDHPNIIKFYEVFEDEDNIYFVLEDARGGDLFDRLKAADTFREDQAAIIMKQMLSAVAYMHANNVTHRALRPESIQVSELGSISDINLIKITNFQGAVPFSPGQPLTSKAGVPYYIAPEVLQGNYDEKRDNWAMGVIMYTLLAGYPPFWGDTDADVLAKVMLNQWSFDGESWSSCAKDIIRGLLTVDTSSRLTAQQALSDPWMTSGNCSTAALPPTTNVDPAVSGVASVGQVGLITIAATWLSIVASMSLDQE